MSCTILSTRSNSGHISWHVPTGVMAFASEVGLFGSERTPFVMASLLSFSRFFLSYQESERKKSLWMSFGQYRGGRGTYILIELAHLFLV